MEVLFLDRWADTSIQTHFYPISKSLKENGYQSMLFHFGSIFGKNNSDNYDSLKVVDVKEFPLLKRDAFSVLNKYSPKIVVFCGSPNQPTIQAFQYACSKKGIKVGWLQFGTVHFFENKKEDSFSTKIDIFNALKNILFSMAYLVLTILKAGDISNTYYFIFNYCKAFFILKQQYIFSKLNFIIRPNFSIALNRISSLQYESYGVKTNHIVGNPFVADYVINELKSHSDEILIILQPFFETGQSDSFIDLLEDYREISLILIGMGYQVNFKMHPLNSQELATELKKIHEQVKVKQKGDVYKMISEAKIILGVTSTLLVVPAFMRKKILLLKWLDPIYFDHIGYGKYGIFKVSESIKDFKDSFNQLGYEQYSESEYLRFKDDFIGPAIGDEAIENMAHYIVKELKN